MRGADGGERESEGVVGYSVFVVCYSMWVFFSHFEELRIDERWFRV